MKDNISSIQREFVTKLLNTLVCNTNQLLQHSNKTVDIHITYKGWNRYISLKRHRENLDFLFFTDGNVVIKYREEARIFFSGEMQIFNYKLDADLNYKEEKFLNIAHKILDLFVEDNTKIPESFKWD